MIIERGNNVVRRRVTRDWLLLPPERPHTTSTQVLDVLRQIKEDVCERHGISLAGLEGPRRSAKYAAARGEFCRLAYSFEGISLPAIGRAINRDHTTVLHHVRKGQQ